MSVASYKYQDHKLTISSNGKNEVYTGAAAKQNLIACLRSDIEQLKQKIEELQKWYTNPDNYDKPNWRDIMNQYNCTVLKLESKEARLKNTRFYKPDPGCEPVHTGVIFYED